jgi:hypothetical protein
MGTPERSRTATSAESWEHCQQRHDLLARLREALQDFGTAVRESRGRGASGSADRTEAAGALVCSGMGRSLQASGRAWVLAATAEREVAAAVPIVAAKLPLCTRD